MTSGRSGDIVATLNGKAECHSLVAHAAEVSQNLSERTHNGRKLGFNTHRHW